MKLARQSVLFGGRFGRSMGNAKIGQRVLSLNMRSGMNASRHEQFTQGRWTNGFMGKSFYSTTPGEDEPAAGRLEAVTEVASQVTDLRMLDPPVSSLSWYPSDLVASGIDHLHSFTGLAWWQDIIVATVILRFLTFPFTLSQRRTSLRMPGFQKELKLVQEKIKPIDEESRKRFASAVQAAQNRHGVKVWHSLAVPLTQIPIFASVFFGLRNMAERYPSMTEGGIWLWPDLTVVDATYALPVVCSATFMAMAKLGADDAAATSGAAVQDLPEEERLEQESKRNQMRLVMYGLGIMMFPVALQQANAVTLYWTATNVFSIAQTFAFKIPGVNNLLGIKLKHAGDKPTNGKIIYKTQAMKKKFGKDGEEQR